jgi:hypothetical protein
LEFKLGELFFPEEAFKSLRKLPLFGHNDGAQPDFEWPTLHDIKQMPKDGNPIKVVAIEWQVSN